LPIVAAVALLSIEAAGLYGAYRDLAAGAGGLRTAADHLGRTPDSWTPAHVDAASRSEADAAARLDRGRRRLQSDPLVWVALRLPFASDQARTVLDLAAAGAAADAAVKDAIGVAANYDQAQAGAKAEPGAALIALLEQAAPKLADADSKLADADRSLAADSHRRLLPPLARAVAGIRQQLEPAAGAAHQAAQAAALAPAALGATAPKTYLVLLPNPSELRPTGGFSGQVGSATISQGKITNLVLQKDSVYAAKYKQSFPPPLHEGTYLSFPNNQVGIGDAGWDPDFPTSARTEEAMFLSATGTQVDGTVSIDPYFLSSLVAVTGPVDVPGYGSFNSTNLFPQLNILVNVQGGQKGEQAPSILAKAIIAKLLAQPSSRWAALAKAVQQGVEEGHVQVVADQPELQTLLHQAHADGSLIPTPLTEDYLMLVEANVAGDKADYFIKRSLSVKVEIYPSGLNRHEVDIHYEYPPAVDRNDTALNTTPYNPNSLYRDYVRFYLPLTATLAHIGYLEDGQPAPAYGGGLQEQEVANQRQVIGTFFILHRGHSADLILDYEVGLPADPPFQLYFQKQAGIPSIPVEVEVSYPGGVTDRKTTLVKDAVFTIPW
jgi:hypothetical protein